MMKKTHKPTPKKTIVPKKGSSWDEYFSIRTWGKQPISEEGIEAWATEMIEWVTSHPDPRYLSQFWRTKGITESEFYRLVDKYPVLKEAKNYALHVIGENIHMRSVDGKANWHAVKGTMWRHAQCWADDDKHAAALKESSEASGDIHLHFPKVPSSDEVPHKPGKEQ